MSLSENIIKIVDDNPGILAKDIANKLGINKQQVNELLYGNLKQKVIRDDDYCWYIEDQYEFVTTEDDEISQEPTVSDIEVEESVEVDIENIDSSINDTSSATDNTVPDDESPTTGFAFDSLESVRKKLLDLTGKNALISYRHPRASCIRLIDELPDQIYEVLTAGETFTFIPVPEPTESELVKAGYIEITPDFKTNELREYPSAEQWAKYLGLDTRYDLPSAETAEDANDRHLDTKLQTLLYSAELDARLRSIRGKSNTAIEESGSNILYLALGFLEWFESRDSDVARLAPLFTIPVQLERQRIKGVYRYNLTLKEDGLLTNITFREKLINDFGLELPLIGEDTTPEMYFQIITKTILNEQPRWRIRRQATLVLLNFAKQAMYQDLDPDNWPQNARIDNHELIKMFFGSYGGGGKSGDGASYANEHSIDKIEDAHDNYPLIYDADSSQHSALIDVVKGNNLVIEGPPGSGKSQTITNLIAACIANGKKVLFVAEKMAALNVVKSKLDKANLGDFCLELHSHKTHKLQILQDLTQRLNKQDEYCSPASLSADIERYEDLKSKLHTYVEAINNQWKNTGLTIHQILNKATRYREQYGINPEQLHITGIDGETLNLVKQKELIDQADMLANVYEQVSEQAKDGVIENHYWYGIENTDLKGFQIEELHTHLSSWTSSLESLKLYWDSIVVDYDMADGVEATVSEIETYQSSLEKLPELKGGELLSDVEFINKHQDEFLNMLENYKTIHEEINNLNKVIKPEYINKPDTTNLISDSLKIIQSLGVNFSVSLDSISNDITELEGLNKLTNVIGKQFEKIRQSAPSDISLCFDVTQDGLKEFEILVGLINKLSPELWRHRDEIYDNSDLDGLLNHLTNSLRDLTPIHKELIDQFSLHRLPTSVELIQHKSVLDNAGLFRIFSSEWRNAKRSILTLSATPKPDKTKLVNLLPSLISYAQGIEDIDKLNSDDPLLNDLYRGIETPVERLIELRKWYQAVRNEYGVGFGDRVAIGNALIGLDRNLAISIADVASHGLLDEVNSSISTLSSILLKYTELQQLKNELTQLDGDDSPLVNLHDTLSTQIKSLSTVVVGQTIELSELLSINDKLKRVQTDIGVWLKNEVTQHVVPKILPLSIRSGEFSENLYLSGKNSLFISDVITKCNFLKKVFLNNPSIQIYNKLRDELPKVQELSSSVNNYKTRFFELGKVDFSQWLELSGDVIEKIVSRNMSALDNPNWLNTWLDYLRLREKLYSHGLKNIIESLESEKIQTKDLNEIVQLVLFHQLSEEIFEEDSYIAQFSGMEQMAIRSKFQDYDRKLMVLQQEKIAFKASRKKPEIGNNTGKVSTYSEVSLIQHEAGKKKGHIAVRSLLERSGKAIQALKPCFMMSPMSVAQYLKPGNYEFDLVVMDEASQIRPEDALGSIARGKKLVVVGDPKQLPPTSFFSKTLTNDDTDEDAVALEESESILEAVIPMFKTRRLRWHYRSRHESLIAFSNQHFYDSNLILFPSPFQESEEFGIRFKRVERGRFNNRRNVEEAREVVLAVAIQLQNNPKESVGIVAMNAVQQAEIEQQLDQLVKDDPLLADSWDKNRELDEPLFIKNLENVQGDERDVIFISMTYGPLEIGGRPPQRFGPINSNVGWRRLNVLFTRSKKRMHIFSSMGFGDVVLSGTSSRGVQSLKHFLAYCETGHLHHATHTGKPADSDFEIAVMRALADHGYECEPQLGVAGYYLDLAVIDPGMPGKFLMGVECDGATYHSAKSTRDRDRLRQDILENLGWKIRRIWSTDWFKNPQAQIQPIIQELDKLKTPIVERVETVIDENLSEDVSMETPLVQESLDLAVDNYQAEIGEDVDLKERLVLFSKSIAEINDP
ncbi:MAG: DUF4011 domain-containing protein, partial [Methylococcales bacterium]